MGRAWLPCQHDAVGRSQTKPSVQAQEQDLRAAQDQAAQSSAEALWAQENLQEAERRLMVLAEDDRDLRDKVPHAKLPAPVCI